MVKIQIFVGNTLSFRQRYQHSPATVSIDKYEVNQVGQQQTRDYTNLIDTDQQASPFLYNKNNRSPHCTPLYLTSLFSPLLHSHSSPHSTSLQFPHLTPSSYLFSLHTIYFTLPYPTAHSSPHPFTSPHLTSTEFSSHHLLHPFTLPRCTPSLHLTSLHHLYLYPFTSLHTSPHCPPPPLILPRRQNVYYINIIPRALALLLPLHLKLIAPMR